MQRSRQVYFELAAIFLASGSSIGGNSGKILHIFALFVRTFTLPNVFFHEVY